MPTETTQGPGSTSPTDEEPEPLLGEVPGFRRPPDRHPTNDPPTRTLPADTPTVTSSTTEGPSQSPSDGSQSPRTGPSSSSPASTPEPPADPTALEPLAGEVIRLLVGVPAFAVNERRTPGTDIWLLDDQDIEAIAGPLSRIAARRLPAGEGTSDVVDGAMAVLGMGGYVMKNLDRERRMRAVRGGATLEAPGGVIDAQVVS